MLDETAELGLRERKKRAARTAIQRTALEMVVEHGFCHVSVEDIANAAGVSPRTFFNYYPTKEDALFATDVDRLESADAFIRAADSSGGPMAVVRAALLDWMDESRHDLSAVHLRRQILDREPSLFGGFLRASQSTQAHWVAALKDRFADEDPLPDGYIELVVAVVWTAIGIALHVWSTCDQQQRLIDILGRQLDQLAVGLAHPLPDP